MLSERIQLDEGQVAQIITGPIGTERAIVGFNWKLFFSAVVFSLCLAPTIVSYQSYLFAWDDSDYLVRSIAASQAFWSGDGHGLRNAMVSIRPPVMTLLGIPWGSLGSWDAAGKCFVTLTAFIALAVACCLFFLLRIGVKPFYLLISSACVFAALGPYPGGADAHLFATGFLADSLFAWTALAAVLLIPYEATIHTSSTTDDLVRGILWGLVFSGGAIIKVSFLFFIAVTIPILFVIRVRYSGLRKGCVTLASFSACSLPVIIYYLRYGKLALHNGVAASFGHDASFYHVPISQFLGSAVRQSPGLLLGAIFVIACIVYWIVKRRDIVLGTNIIPLLIIIGYCATSLASSNREIRFLFPGIIGLPFLIGMLISGKTALFPRGSAIIAAILVFCCLVTAGLPMLHRADRQSIAKSEAVLGQAVEVNAKRVLLATDTSSLNLELLNLAIAISSPPHPVETDTLSWDAAFGQSIDDDFRKIRDSDLIVFLNGGPPFTNQRAPEYEQYARQYFGDVPIKIEDGIRMYGRHHSPQ